MEDNESNDASVVPQLNRMIRPNSQVSTESRDGESNPGPELYKIQLVIPER